MIGAIIVLYNPNWTITKKSLALLSNQVHCVCVVDNSLSNNSDKVINISNLVYIPNYKNIGIAAAQNIGIEYLIKNKYDYIVFSDQDSIPENSIVDILFDNLQCLHNCNIKVAAVGTRAINSQSFKPYSAKSKEFDIIKEGTIRNNSDLTECYSVRSSISMIPSSSLLSVGYFDESLFIDGVDHEWCWRAWHKCGLRSFIVEKAQIIHKLGEGDKKLLNKDIAISSSFRLYYQYRNFIRLYKRDYVPKFWKRENLFKYIVKSIYYPIMVSPRIENLKSIYNGIIDGLKTNKSI